MTFDYCNLTLASNVAFPELATSSRQAPELTFIMSAQRAPRPSGEPIQQWELPGGSAWLTMSRTAGGYMLQFPELATFHVSVRADTVRCWPLSGTPLDTLRHLFLDQVMPLVLSLAGRTVFHASAVATNDGAIAFSGESGRGKSTLAGSFVNHGASLLTDDCLLLDDAFRVVPSYPGLRLWPDVAPAIGAAAAAFPRVCHYSGKGRIIDALPFSSHPMPLRRLYLLAQPSDAISITALSPRDALIELVKCCFVLDIADPEALKARFEMLSRLAMLGVVYHLSYPRDLDRLPELHNAILRHVAVT